MGRETKNFRQTNKSRSGDASSKSYGRINRMQGWSKFINIFKKGDKPKWQG